MPASGGISLADANVWLAVAFSDHLHHAKAKAWFEEQNDASCGFCRVTRHADGPPPAPHQFQDHGPVRAKPGRGVEELRQAGQ